MFSGSVVFYKIATTCLLIFVGYIARRMQLVPENSLSVFSKFVVNFALPCYIIFHMPATISPSTLSTYWFYPLIGIALMAGSDLFGYVAARLWAQKGELPTFRMLVGMPNWVFMALAVCEPLFGEVGVRVVLLYNVGIMLYIWSAGMTSFRGGMGWNVAKSMFVNPQMIASVIGLTLALTIPGLGKLHAISTMELAAMPFAQGLFTTVWETVQLVAITALPLSIIQIGILLGAPLNLSPEEWRKDNRSLVVASALRLLASPTLSILTLVVMVRLGINYSYPEFMTSAIVMAMPAAVLCISVSDVYGGNTLLAARGILWTTILGLASAPVMTKAAEWAYGFFIAHQSTIILNM